MAIVVPVFQYSNVYRPTPKLAQLAKCKALQQRCIEQCSKVNYSNYRSAAAITPKAKVRDVFRIFASMAHGATFGELCVRFNPAALNINEKQMVLFGLLEGLIRRVEKYPITVQRNLFYDDEPIRPSCTDSTETVDTIATVTATTNGTTSKITRAIDSKYTIFNNCGSQPLPRGEARGKSHAHHHSRANRLDMIDMDGHVQRPRQISTPQHRVILYTPTAFTVHYLTENLIFVLFIFIAAKVRGQSSSNHSTYHYYNGLHSFDEICTIRGISSQQLEFQLAKDRHVIVLLR